MPGILSNRLTSSLWPIIIQLGYPQRDPLGQKRRLTQPKARCYVQSSGRPVSFAMGSIVDRGVVYTF